MKHWILKCAKCGEDYCPRCASSHIVVMYCSKECEEDFKKPAIPLCNKTHKPIKFLKGGY